MKRNIDLRCTVCPHEQANVICEEEAILECPHCHAALEQVWWKRTVSRNAQWDDNTSVMVFKDAATGKVRYPGRHDAKMPAGYERVYLRSLREVESFEKQHNVRSEMAWYDKGTARGFDDNIQ